MKDVTRLGIVQTAQLREPCNVCGCPAEKPCDCAPGVHLCRVLLLASDGHITRANAAELMYDADVYDGRQVISL